MRCELLRRVRYSVVGLTDVPSVRVAGTARNRMPLFVRLPACLPRDSRVRACVHGTHAESPRPGFLAPWHVAVDDSDPVLASPRRWVMRSSFTTVLVFFFSPCIIAEIRSQACRTRDRRRSRRR
jgi:hypothetical protein